MNMIIYTLNSHVLFTDCTICLTYSTFISLYPYPVSRVSMFVSFLSSLGSPPVDADSISYLPAVAYSLLIHFLLLRFIITSLSLILILHRLHSLDAHNNFSNFSSAIKCLVTQSQFPLLAVSI